MLPDPFRMTRQRQLILDEIRKLKTHPTADEMYQILREKMPRISLGTVYRNLETLSKTGFLRKIDVGGTQKRFDGDISEHYHVRCMNCSRVDDLFIDYDMSLAKKAKRATDFKILRHNIEFVGLCPPCKKEQSK
jgi:Fur family ferric uptake transcriptional regulator